MADIDKQASQVSKLCVTTALMDTSAFDWTRIVKTVIQEHTFRWNGVLHTEKVLGTQRRTVNPNEKWKLEQVEAMPTIMRLARDGELQLSTYSELSHETEKASFPCWRGYIGDLMHNVQLQDVPAAIERSKLQQMDMKEYLEKGTFILFCKFLLQLQDSILATKPRFLSLFSELEKKNLHALDRFRAMCNSLQETHYPDAFHLWTAEVNNLDYFLTIDKKFINAMTMTSKALGRAKPIAPRDLATELSVDVLDPMPVSHYDFRPLLE